MEEHLTASEIAGLDTEEILDLAAEACRRLSSLAGLVALLSGELDRRESWRAEGATSVEDWLVGRMGFSAPTAKAYAHVGDRLFDLPHLASALSSGQLTFDKVRAVADVATPQTDRELATTATELSVRDLNQMARAHRRPTPRTDEADQEHRAVRFNDTFRTITAQLPPSSYAEARARLEERARKAEGGPQWDQRLADAFMELIRMTGRRSKVTATSGTTLVAHAPLGALLDESSTLCGELEHGGWVSAAVLRRLACDATLIVAVDDDAGHTMYEGRAQRFATDTQRRELWRRDRHCRFPSCGNATFTVPHHVERWKPDHGPTDLPNLALLCEYHHHLVHSRGWAMWGDANELLTFEGPSGVPMRSTPSPLWTQVADQRPPAPGP